MVARNHSWRRLCAPLEPSSDRVAQQIETYFAANPQLSPESFLLSALRRELAFRNWHESGHKLSLARLGHSQMSQPIARRLSRTESDVRLHGLLAARVVALH